MAQRIKFDEIERDLKKTREKATEVTQSREAVQAKLAAVLGEQKLADMEISLDDPDFQATRKNEQAFEANIATLIFGLDEVTKTFGEEFRQMSQMTTGEKVMSFFSRRKGAEMRSSRVRSTDIRGNLTTLIEKSNVIQEILTEQLSVLSDRLAKNIVSQRQVQERAQEAAGEIEKVQEEIGRLGPAVAALDERLTEATGEERKRIEIERTELVNSFNEAQSNLQSKTAEAQSLERYASQYASYIESLTRQKAAQETLIAKLKIDTEQRTVLYDTLAESLKTGQQQEIAHRIDEVGSETDAQAEELMLQAGVSASNKIVGMMESHALYMQRTEQVRKKGQIAQQTFEAKFGEIIKNVDAGRYSGAES